MPFAETIDPRLVIAPSEEEKAKARRHWGGFVQSARIEGARRFIANSEGGAFRDRSAAGSIIDGFEDEDKERNLSQVILIQSFEGTVLTVKRDHVTIEFDTRDGPQLRRFNTKEVDTTVFDKGDVVRLQCEMSLVPPTQPLTPDEVQEWLMERSGREIFRSKLKRAKPLLEEDE